MCDKKVQLSVAVIIHPGAAGPIAGTRMQQTRSLGDIDEFTVTLITEQKVLAPTGDKDVVEPIVIVIADRDSRCPHTASQARLRGDVFERAVAVVVIKTNGGTGWSSARCTAAGKHHDIHPAVVVVIEKRAAAADGVEDIVCAAWVAIND